MQPTIHSGSTSSYLLAKKNMLRKGCSRQVGPLWQTFKGCRQWRLGKSAWNRHKVRREDTVKLAKQHSGSSHSQSKLHTLAEENFVGTQEAEAADFAE
jgi:hypothetical protein